MIEVTIIPVLKDNYAYLIRAADGTNAIVDPGEAAPVIETLERLGLKLDFILNTHHHGDHTAGNAALKAKYGATVLAPEAERGRIPAVDRGMRGGEVFMLGGEAMHTIETPGHTLGAVCLHFPESKVLFTGDTLFLMGCGRLFEGTPAQMHDSLAKIAALPDETLIYCGHEYTVEATEFCLSIEPDNQDLKQRQIAERAKEARGEPTVPATLALEKKTNVFLRAQTLEQFTAYREKRNHF